MHYEVAKSIYKTGEKKKETKKKTGGSGALYNERWWWHFFFFFEWLPSVQFFLCSACVYEPERKTRRSFEWWISLGKKKGGRTCLLLLLLQCVEMKTKRQAQQEEEKRWEQEQERSVRVCVCVCVFHWFARDAEIVVSRNNVTYETTPSASEKIK